MKTLTDEEAEILKEHLQPLTSDDFLCSDCNPNNEYDEYDFSHLEARGLVALTPYVDCPNCGCWRNCVYVGTERAKVALQCYKIAKLEVR